MTITHTRTSASRSSVIQQSRPTIQILQDQAILVVQPVNQGGNMNTTSPDETINTHPSTVMETTLPPPPFSNQGTRQKNLSFFNSI